MLKKIICFSFLLVVILFFSLVGFNKQTSKNNFFKEENADLNNNSLEESYVLKNGSLSVEEDSKIIWQSPEEWWIDDFVLADSNNDGSVNINLSFWRAGSFGTSKPFWIEENDKEVGNHFFVLSLINQEVKQVWGSSRLSNPNCEFKITDIDNDGENDLIVLEGSYEDEICQGKYLAIWQWNGWGFSNKWRSEEAHFSDLEADSVDYILD